MNAGEVAFGSKEASVAPRCCACDGDEFEPFLRAVPDRLGVTEGTHRYDRCRGCGLVALVPRPTISETGSFYPQSFWRTREEAQDTLPKRAEAWLRDRLVQADFAFVKEYFTAGARHLDVGCATGDFIALCQSRGTRSKGIELSESAAAYCRSVRGLDVTAADLVSHDFGEERFDVITYNGVLEHVPNPREHLEKCARLLAPGGRLFVLGLPNIRAFGFRLAQRAWIGLDAPRHIHQFSLDSARRLLEGAGFRVVRVIPRSPRFNPPSLVASLFPALHRHKFDALEAATGKNPIARKAALFALLQAARPLDAVLCRLGLSEHLTLVAELEAHGS